jgi:hypothetical protein
VLAITKAPPNSVVLSWTTAAPGYRLQAAGALNSTPPSQFLPVSPLPVVRESRYTVTNTAAGARRYYQLER